MSVWKEWKKELKKISQRLDELPLTSWEKGGIGNILLTIQENLLANEPAKISTRRLSA